MTITPTDNTTLLFGVTVAPVPEPGSLALAGAGLAGLLGCGWRRGKHRAAT